MILVTIGKFIVLLFSFLFFLTLVFDIILPGSTDYGTIQGYIVAVLISLPFLVWLYRKIRQRLEK